MEEEHKVQTEPEPKPDEIAVDGKEVARVVAMAKARFRTMLKATLERPELKAARRKRRKSRSTADTFNVLADVAGLTMEEQVRMQIACLTQGVVDSAARASAVPQPDTGDDDDSNRYPRVPVVPADARRSYRNAEIHNQTHLALATARLVDTVARTSGGLQPVRHAFTYEHLHRHMQEAAPKTEEQPEEEEGLPPEEHAESITEQVFDHMHDFPDPSLPPRARG